MFQKGNQCAKLRGKPNKEYKAMLEKQVPAAIDAIVDIFKHSTSDKCRLAAACALLDRCYGRPKQAVDVTNRQQVDQNAIMAALADQARGVIINSDENGVTSIMVSPSYQLPEAIPVEAHNLTLDDENEDAEL